MTSGATLFPAATRRPQAVTPTRPPGSVRRSSYVGLRWPGSAPGHPAAPMQVHGSVRDVATDHDGRGLLVGEASLDCTVAPDRTVTDLAADPSLPGLAGLLGQSASRGWRAAARVVAADDTRVGLLLADVPIAVLLSSYAALRQGRIEVATVTPLMQRMRDACAGWADGATPMRSLDAGDGLPLPGMVPVPQSREHQGREDHSGDESDPVAIEQHRPPVAGELRRSRRLDVTPGPSVHVEASFRDSWHDPAAGEGVLHEYVLVADLTADLVVESITADPRVLPYPECTVAAQSPQRLVGRPVGDVRQLAPTVGDPTSCTHLNDLLRTLAAVPSLLAQATTGDGPDLDW